MTVEAVPMPHRMKQRVVQEYSDMFLIDDLIETGTYAGEMIDACRYFFKSIVSIELSRPHYEEASKLFSGRRYIRLYHGDSGAVLPEILKQVAAPRVFWLDGHYSGESTAKGELNTPILKELDAIFSHEVLSHVILIDDARCFNGEDDYPALSDLEIEVRRRRPDLAWSVRDDIIRIHTLRRPSSPGKRIRQKLVRKARSWSRR